jgi:hypothetical protein
MSIKQVYLAAPCFSAAERAWNLIIKTELENYGETLGMEFYLPQQNVKESWSSHEIREELVKGLENSQVLVANLDGPGGDDGTCWEMGFVAGMNSVLKMVGHNPLKKIFWYRTDFRNGGDSELNVNLMMAHGGTQIVIPNDVGTLHRPVMAAQDIADALYHNR